MAYGVRIKRRQRSHNFQQQTTSATKKSVITKRFVVKLCVECQFYGNESRVDANAQFICFNMSFISGMRCEHWMSASSTDSALDSNDDMKNISCGIVPMAGFAFACFMFICDMTMAIKRPPKPPDTFMESETIKRVKTKRHSRRRETSNEICATNSRNSFNYIIAQWIVFNKGINLIKWQR